MAADIPPATASGVDLRPNPTVLIVGSIAIAAISILSLPGAAAIASIVLGGLMIAGAEVDARTCLLPNAVTVTAAVLGVLFAMVLDAFNPWGGAAVAMARAGGTALILALLRFGYGRLRAREGLGFGDVKLAAAVGAWLPLQAIPLCFGLASAAALVTVLWARWRGQTVEATMKIPFGAFLCPSLWLVFYATTLIGLLDEPDIAALFGN